MQQQKLRVLAYGDLFGCNLLAVAVFALKFIPFVEQLFYWKPLHTVTQRWVLLDVYAQVEEGFLSLFGLLASETHKRVF